MKMRRSDTDPSFEEKYLDAKDELEATKEENEDLRRRLAEFEEEHLSELRNVATESEKDARIARLVQANRELEVIAQNVSGESELKKQERKYERLLERCKVYEEGLEATLAKERQVRSPLLSLHLANAFFSRRNSKSLSALSSSISPLKQTSSPAAAALPMASRTATPSPLTPASSPSWPSPRTSTPSALRSSTWRTWSSRRRGGQRSLGPGRGCSFRCRFVSR